MTYVPKSLCERVRKRANFTCEYCKRPERLVGQRFEIEHIKPESKGGTTTEDNLALACRICNSYKSDAETGLDSEAAKQIRLFNPRIDKWSDHFAWSEKAEITGKTDVGRASLHQLRLNEPPIVEARQAWIRGGWQPPDSE